MNKNYLLKTAKELKSASPQAADEYLNKKDELTHKINEAMLNRPDIKKLVGKDNLDMMKDNHANHVRFIGSVLKKYNAEVMTNTVLWVFNTYLSHGFTSNYWAAQLNSWIEILKEVLTPQTYEEVFPLYEWMQVNIPVFVKVSEEIDDVPDSLH